MRSGEPLYVIHSDRIRALSPDLIIAQSHCQVCAVTPDDVARGGGSIPGAKLLSISAGSVDGIFGSMLDIARALDLEQRGLALVACEKARLDRLRGQAARFRRPTVLVLEWTDPIFPMGNWGPELVEVANGELAAGKRDQHSSAIPAEQVYAADPEYLIVAPCGFDLARSMQELQVLERYPWWNRLRAVRTGQVAFCDGNLLFNRSGMTITRTAEVIAEILHGLVSGEPSQGRDWRWMRDIPVATGVRA